MDALSLDLMQGEKKPSSTNDSEHPGFNIVNLCLYPKTLFLDFFLRANLQFFDIREPPDIIFMLNI